MDAGDADAELDRDLLEHRRASVLSLIPLDDSDQPRGLGLVVRATHRPTARRIVSTMRRAADRYSAPLWSLLATHAVHDHAPVGW